MRSARSLGRGGRAAGRRGAGDRILAAPVDGVVLVHAGSVKRRVVTRAVEMLRKGRARARHGAQSSRPRDPGFIYRRI
jgi:hypothetical protein